MIREQISNTVGLDYLTTNVEESEFSYPKAFKAKGIEFVPIKKRGGGAYLAKD